MKPKVSIIIPVYNGSNYLKEAIDSALEQTYKNIEILVINDGSNDKGKTAKIARSYGKKIIYYEKENGGVASALNFGIKKMKGAYFSWLSHDDVYLPNKISTNVNAFRKIPQKSVLYSDFELIGGNGKHLCFSRSRSPKNQFLNYLIFRRIVHGCTVFLPRGAFLEVGLFNEKMPNAQDYEMWFRLLKKNYVFRRVPMILIKSRSHSEQGVVKRKKLQLADEEHLYSWVVKNFTIEKIYGPTEDKMFAYLELAKNFKTLSLKKTAFYCKILSLRYLSRKNFRRNVGFLVDTFRKNPWWAS